MKNKLETILSEQINKFTTLLNSKEADIYKNTPLSPSQLNYLEIIPSLENPTVTRLAEYLKIKKPTVTNALNILIDAGYLKKIKSKSDGRSFSLKLTTKGEKIVSDLNEERQKIAVEILGSLTKKESLQFAWLLNKIIDSESF